EVLHLPRREVPGDAQGVTGLGELLLLVGLLQPDLVLVLADGDVVYARERLPLLREVCQLLGLHPAIETEPPEPFPVLLAREASRRLQFQGGSALQGLREHVALLLR